MYATRLSGFASHVTSLSAMIAGAKCILEERGFSTPSAMSLRRERSTNAYTPWMAKR